MLKVHHRVSTRNNDNNCTGNIKNVLIKRLGKTGKILNAIKSSKRNVEKNAIESTQ